MFAFVEGNLSCIFSLSLQLRKGVIKLLWWAPGDQSRSAHCSVYGTVAGLKFIV